jgi:hypothetical protein
LFALDVAANAAPAPARPTQQTIESALRIKRT